MNHEPFCHPEPVEGHQPLTMIHSTKKKQFRLILFETSLSITTTASQTRAYQKSLDLPKGIALKIGSHDWLETDFEALNYYECCGILILFGITPPSFTELYHLFTTRPP